MPMCVTKAHANMQTSTNQPYVQVQFFLQCQFPSTTMTYVIQNV
jgi:hypothetical protein